MRARAAGYLLKCVTYRSFGKSARMETLAVHGGQQLDDVHRAIIPPITTATSFVQTNVGEYGNFHYSRVNNPTRLAYETALADLEGGTFATATASGVAAASLALELLPHSSYVISMTGIYGGTHRLFEQVRRYSAGHDFTYIDLNDSQLLSGVLKQTFARCAEKGNTEHPRIMVWIETPTNPLLQLVDLQKVVGIVRDAEKAGEKVLIVVDNTFATAYNQRPLAHGADVVMLSSSKYIGGHSDLTGGALVVGDMDLAERLRLISKAVGAIASPFDSYTALRGMKTLAVRMQRQSENAQQIADFLQGHEKVADIHFPGLERHPQYELCKRQMRTPGAVLTVRLASPKSTAGVQTSVQRFIGALELFVLAESLGGVESMINHCATMSHGGMTSEERENIGIFNDTLRISCGIEAIEDLLEDLERGLAAI
eukprot:TRINITY_DN65402_c0_g1_i1.p1 TRINITY_DN65402_c0_g1~~TRINITY_DN65402_c0_g1_i1.p1  ORF type:complete len:427 (+),score=52.11 TRINITY_DN65402_c0_g1_i1:96-1376(+)